jgi:hypothetical protein
MPSATWTISVDLNNDRDYSDTGEDLSAFVIDADWSLGFAAPFDPISRSETLTLTLKNADKRFSPEYAGGALYPNFAQGKLVRVQSTYSGVTRTHFLGWIDEITPAPGIKKERRASVKCNGYMLRAQEIELFIPAQENKRADEVLATIIQKSGLVPPGFNGAWLLGVAGASELGQTTRLGSLADLLNAETGISTFSIIGDNWDKTSAYGALRDTVGREGGRLFVDRSGVVQFWNRHHLIKDTVADAAFNNTMMAMEYDYGVDIANHVIVRARPRIIGSIAEPLGQLDKATKIKAGETKNLSFRYGDSSTGAKIAGKNAVAPVAVTDFTANTNENGSGADYSTLVVARIVDEGATRSQVAFTNGAPVDLWVQPGAQIRGIKITDYGEIDADVEDEASIAAYRRRKHTYEHVFDDVDVAQGMAEFILAERKNPRGRIRSLVIPAYKSDALLAQVLTRTMGDRITVTETQTGASSDYFIIGEQFKLASKNLLVTWTLEPASSHTFWLLGVTNFSELGQTTWLGPF